MQRQAARAHKKNMQVRTRAQQLDKEMKTARNAEGNATVASETERTSTNTLSSGGSLPQVTAAAAAAAAAASAASDHAIAAVNAAYGVTNSSSAVTEEDAQKGTGDAVHDVSAIPRPVPQQQQQNKRKKKNKSKPTKKKGGIVT